MNKEKMNKNDRISYGQKQGRAVKSKKKLKKRKLKLTEFEM